MIKLTAELVPKSSWYSNVRSEIPKREWDIIRKKVYADAGYVCEICGGKGKKHPVECHEVWEYDDDAHTQTLVRMIALCPACHSVKHLGRARAVGIYHMAIGQLMKVNGWTRDEANKYASNVFNQWKERSEHEWMVKLDGLIEYDSIIEEDW